MPGKHKFNAGAICEHCGKSEDFLNARRDQSRKLPLCPDADDSVGKKFFGIRKMMIDSLVSFL